jgi:ppGpp synthetase/RelA/SpoT-type nucleotidyltranferase
MPPKYSRTRLDRAVEILTSDSASYQEKEKADDMLRDWRELHALLLEIYAQELEDCVSSVDPLGFTARRLKRFPTILHKIKERKTIHHLSQMQDVAGFRAVVNSVDFVNSLLEKYKRKHPHSRVKDYIQNPKETGYRGIHLISQHRDSRDPDRDGLSFEIQFRTKLQHLWATAVETVDAFYKDSLKYSSGSKEWTDFFKLTSAAFSCWEDQPLLPSFQDGTCEQITDQLRQFIQDNSIYAALEGIRLLDFVEDDDSLKNSRYWVLVSHLDEETKIYGFPEGQTDAAVSVYNDKERRARQDAKSQVVLISVDSFKKIQEAYPNLFSDIQDFLFLLNEEVG